jgi:hypothetical protein
MVKLSAGRRTALAAIVVIGVSGLVAGSPRARASFRAAYAAFRDPSLVRDRPDEPSASPRAPSDTEIEQPELSADFGRLSEADLADAGVGEIASFTMPDIPIPISQRTLRFMAYFAASEKGREAFSTRYRRAGRFRRYIEQALRDADLPEDLLWLCAIESGFEPQATSPKGAVGLFQFMPETGARYGLAQTEMIDERRSVTRSTAAGVQHLRDLFDRYQKWDLALAAYNFGPDRLDEALQKLQQRRGPREAKKPVELQDLVDARLIPKETANFVPQVQAFALVAANRGRFGLDDLDPAPPFDLGEIVVPAGTPLRIVARAAGISLATLRDYNPGLLRDRTPPEGGETMVSVPADKVGAALAAFPALYARTMEKEAAGDAGADAGSLDAGAPPPASGSASSAPAEPPSDRFTVAGGVIVVRQPSSAPEETVAARVEIVERGLPRAGSAFEVEAQTARPAELPAALARVAAKVHALVTDGGEAIVAARRRAGESRRQQLAKAPYGNAWLTLGDRLFPPGHALSGTVLISPAMPLTSVAIAEPPPGPATALRITVTVTGNSTRRALGEAAERAFAGVLVGHADVAFPDHEERVSLSEPWPSARIVFGWLLPSASEAERAALRLGILALAHQQVGKVARTLVNEKLVAVHVRGFLDLGDRASVAAIEVVPAVMHDVADAQRETLAAIAAFAEHGPTALELAAVKAQHRARLQAERDRAGTTAEPREAALARLARIAETTEAVTAEDLAALVKRGFVPAHRVVVITNPKS